MFKSIVALVLGAVAVTVSAADNTSSIPFLKFVANV